MSDEMMYNIPKVGDDDKKGNLIVIGISLFLVLTIVGVYFFNRDKIENVSVDNNEVINDEIISDMSSATPQITVQPINNPSYIEQPSSARKKPATIKSVPIDESTPTQTNITTTTKTEKTIVSSDEYDAYLNKIDRSNYPLVEIE